MLGGCGTPAKTPRSGGYYLDDGPGTSPPADIDRIPDAVPRLEPLNRGTMQPYVVMGKRYTPMTALAPYRARGIATWYGRRYHGRPTASGEHYDMYAMTAAHTTLPIPSYARVTNLRNGRSVVVRINDRGPFVEDRLIDLSYTAAHKLGVLAAGNAMVEVETIIPRRSSAVTAPPAPEPDTAPPTVAGKPDAAIAPPSPVAPPPSPPASEVPAMAGTAGYYLQLGVFGSRANAEIFLERMQTQVNWLAGTLHIFARDGFFRVHAGPYAREAEARRDADRVSQTLGIGSFVLTR